MRRKAVNFFYFVFSSFFILVSYVRGRPIGARNFLFIDVPSDYDFSNDTVVEVFDAADQFRKRSASSLSEVFPVENVIDFKTFSNAEVHESFAAKNLGSSFGAKTVGEAASKWLEFVERSKIPDEYRNGGFHFTGFVGGRVQSWCLPSWVWTNAAIIRMFCAAGEMAKAVSLGEQFLTSQLPCGAWVVRYDYSRNDAMPVVAPNDSAYIANNGMLSLYELTRDEKYLSAATRCADWIIETCRSDGLVSTGYLPVTDEWEENRTIVDIGFTAALFARLFEITGLIHYEQFLARFVEAYIRKFFIPSKSAFATCIDGRDEKRGGRFVRGQAWALEGLSPAVPILGNSFEVGSIVEVVASNLVQKQRADGGWAYNFTYPFLGADCKAIPVVTKALLDARRVCPQLDIGKTSDQARDWCLANTAVTGTGAGGIFSMCMEGAVVHTFCSEVAFVYSSSYALEIWANGAKA